MVTGNETLFVLRLEAKALVDPRRRARAKVAFGRAKTASLVVERKARVTVKALRSLAWSTSALEAETLPHSTSFMALGDGADGPGEQPIHLDAEQQRQFEEQALLMMAQHVDDYNLLPQETLDQMFEQELHFMPPSSKAYPLPKATSPTFYGLELGGFYRARS